MKSIDIKEYLIENNKLILKFNNTLKGKNGIDFCLIDRKSGKESIYKPTITIQEDLLEGIVSFDKITFADVQRGMVDIFIYDGFDKYRARLLKDNEVEQSIRHYSVSCKISKDREATPYLTKDGFCSIMYGNPVLIWKECFKIIKKNLTVSNMIVQDRIIKLCFNIKDIESTDDIYFIADMRKSKNFLQLDIKRVYSTEEQLIFELDLDNSFELGQRYDLKLVKKYGRVVSEYRLGMKNNLVDYRDKSILHDIIELKESTFIRPYITINGGVSIHCNNALNLSNESFSRVDNIEGYVETYQIEGDNLIFVIDKNTIDYLSIFNNKEIWISCNTDYKFTDWIIRDHKIILNIRDLYDKLSPLSKEKKELNFYIRSYGVDENNNELPLVDGLEDIVKVIRLISLSNWKGSKKEQYPIVVPHLDNGFVAYLDLNNTKPIKLIFDTEENYYELTNEIISSKFDIYNLVQDKYIIKFSIISNLILNERIMFYAVKRKTKERILLANQEIGVNTFQIDLESLIKVFGTETSRWDVIAEVNHVDFIESGAIGIFKHAIEIKAKRYLNTIELNTDNYLQSDNVMIPYFDKYSALSIVIRDKKFVYKEKYEYSTEIIDIKMKKNIFSCQFKFSVKNNIDFSLVGVNMKLRSKISKEEYNFNVNILEKSSKYQRAKFLIDLSQIDMNQFYYDFFIVVDINGDQIFARLENCNKELMNKINKSIVSYNWYDDKNAVVYPYITPKGVLFLAYRQMSADEKRSDKLKELIAFPIYKLFRKFFEKKNIWLVYEKNSETAQDNSYYFFKYCYENHPEKNIYYVIKRNYPDNIYLKGMEDKVLYFMSIKHLLYTLSAKLLVASETRGHLYTWRQQKGRIKDILNKKKFVFLQHGVTALKLNDSILSKKSPSAATMYVTSSEFEKRVIMNGLGYYSDDIIVSGFPRWDVLEDKSYKIDKKEIFMMPTWRGWLDEVSEEKFIATDYYKYYMEVLNSKKLNDILETNDIQLNFFLHPKFKQYINNFTSMSSRIRLIEFGEEKVNELLMNASLLITDYSSVAWEMYYMSKPVIFYQFDYKDYKELTGSYIDMEEGLFGDRVFDSNILIEKIQEYINNDFREKEEFASQRGEYFKYIDNNNSKRVYEGIKKSKVLKNI
ncbi:CDP-glycerol glycerophosphotransferase family protein [Gottfriedia acidiceleris]|uniref:CDP-glycerol glycerophosphotransferase family protein n=1 Tax=Gottfriedia acidiceleris TaxID=371036 RepID=UPI000B45122E|nr:CDP-glycerol glycerophosphotransferase family protein [Gottfriedia acidiceleris]